MAKTIITGTGGTSAATTADPAVEGPYHKTFTGRRGE